ncbi:hypothetical protein BXZ70DRAFT_684368 [Cristinia sonorae]|uniref:Uncharacterized protein n=1 Tax=Cristinia sonorae TaxID=1940300 RepID=A0A8K0UV43_9AGAR|nr:hypothetical protein BXZ70DRAFT_684368 [Cristinia sonorae]
MVVLAPRFALLATLAATAALTEVEGAAISHSRRFSQPRTKTAQRRQETQAPSPAAVGGLVPPTLPLPIIGEEKFKSEGAGGAEEKSDSPQQVNKRWDPFGPLLQVGSIWIGDKPAPVKRHSTKVNKGAQRAKAKQEAKQNPQNGDSGSSSPIPPVADLAAVGEKILRREAHKHEHVEKLFITGDYDTIKVNEKRSNPATDLMSSVPPSLLPAIPAAAAAMGMFPHRRALEHEDTIGVHLKARRDLSNFDTIGLHLKRSDPDGVAGRVDIMSPVSNSTAGQRIASLVLSPTAAGGTYQAGSPFILNASGTNSTQIYMVSRPESEPDSSGAADSTATPTNSTTAASDTTTAGSSNGTYPAPSTTDTSSPGYVKVALQIPMFNSEDATMKVYCATFDPKPVEPAPLTVEDCMDPDEAADHKSQTFAYEPSTGVIRPMWFEDDNADSNALSTEDGSEDDEDNGTSVLDGDSGTNSTSAASQDPTTPASSKMASVTSAMALDAQFGDATRPPAFAHSFAAITNSSTPSNSTTMPSNARNVTMVFVPAAPQIVSPERADSLKMESADSLDGDDSGTSRASTVTSAFPSETTVSDPAASGYASYSVSATATSATATATTTLSAADYSDTGDYSSLSASATASSSTAYPSASTVDGLSAPDADFDGLSSSASPTASSSTTPSAPSVSAAAFGLSASTTTSDSASASALPSTTDSVSSVDASSTASAATSSSASVLSAAAYDFSSSATPTATVSTDSSSYPASSAPALSAAAFDASLSAYPTSTYGSDNSTATLSATGLSAEEFTTLTSTASGSSATTVSSSSTDTARPASNTLGVEVYDPNMPLSSSSVSATPSLGAEAVESTSSTDTVVNTVSSTSAAATMTPLSTAPYEWKFKAGTVRN